LFSLLGFRVGIDLSWIIVAVLVSFSLAESVFPHYLPGYSRPVYWLMGIAGVAGLFISIVFHEFCHSMVARYFGLPIRGITLFIFGGVAEMAAEPPNAKSEFAMALAGPVSSVLLGSGFYALYLAGAKLHLPGPVGGVLRYLVWINLVLAVFNMVPAYPLDGGRIFRSVLWAVKGDLRWATKIASSLGSAFGLLLMGLGVVTLVKGGLVGGLWYVLIGMFIRGASRMSYRGFMMRTGLAGVQVGRLMQTNPKVIPAAERLENVVAEYFHPHGQEIFPVADVGRLIGCISLADIGHIPRDRVGEYRVGEMVRPCDGTNTISPSADAAEAVSLMNRTGSNTLLVVDAGRLVGVIRLNDLLNFLAAQGGSGRHEPGGPP